MFIMAVALAALGACGADTATTAATSAAIKKRELEEGKKTMERAREGVDQALEQGQQRNRDAEK
jgi:polyhydroxyalkanoate synthesis regulator phasin